MSMFLYHVWVSPGSNRRSNLQWKYIIIRIIFINCNKLLLNSENWFIIFRKIHPSKTWRGDAIEFQWQIRSNNKYLIFQVFFFKGVKELQGQSISNQIFTSLPTFKKLFFRSQPFCFLVAHQQPAILTISNPSYDRFGIKCQRTCFIG